MTETNFKRTVVIKGIDTAKHEVFGFASVIEDPSGSELVDHQNDTISESEIEQAAYSFVMLSREGKAEHNGGPVAALIESFVITQKKKELLNFDLPRGWWVGFKIFDESIWQRIVARELKMFSIGGRARRVERQAAV